MCSVLKDIADVLCRDDHYIGYRRSVFADVAYVSKVTQFSVVPKPHVG